MAEQPPETSFALSQLPLGAAARIRSVDCQGHARRRLLDLGLVPGTPIEALLSNAAGDPTAYRFRSVVLALRRSDTERIRVSPIEAGETGGERVAALPSESPREARRQGGRWSAPCDG